MPSLLGSTDLISQPWLYPILVSSPKPTSPATTSVIFYRSHHQNTSFTITLTTITTASLFQSVIRVVSPWQLSIVSRTSCHHQPFSWTVAGPGDDIGVPTFLSNIINPSSSHKALLRFCTFRNVMCKFLYLFASHLRLASTHGEALRALV